MVIHFANRIIYVYDVVEPVHDIDSGIVVGRKSFAVARNWGTQRTASDLQTSGTNSYSTCLQIRNHVRNAIGAIARCNEKAGSIGRHSHHRWTGHAAKRIAHVVALAFIGPEEKNFVFDDGTTNRGSELLQSSGKLGIGSSIEIVAGIRHTVASEAKHCTVKRVASRLQTHIDDSAGFPAKLRRRIFLQVKFLDGIDW